MRKYRRIWHKDKGEVLRLYRTGHSMPSVSHLTGISLGNVHKILHAINSDDRVFRCHNLVVHLRSEYGINPKEYADLLRISKILARYEIPPWEILSQVHELIKSCFEKDIDLLMFMASLRGYSQFIQSIHHDSPEDLKRKLASEVKDWETARDAIDNELRKCGELSHDNDYLRSQISNNKKPGESLIIKAESKPELTQVKKDTSETSIDRTMLRELFEYCKDWPEGPETKYMFPSEKENDFIFQRPISGS